MVQCRNGPIPRLAATITPHLRKISLLHQQCIGMEKKTILITSTNNNTCLRATVQEARVDQAPCRIIRRLHHKCSKSK